MVSQHMLNSISFIRADVAVEGDWHNLIEAAKSRYGRLDCLVNNAGTTYSNKVLEPSILTALVPITNM